MFSVLIQPAIGPILRNTHRFGIFRASWRQLMERSREANGHHQDVSAPNAQ